MTRKERLPANVTAYLDRHGKRRYRWRSKGRQHYFHHHPNSVEGKAELAAFLAGPPGEAAPARHAHGTVAWVAARYFVSTTFSGGKGAARLRDARQILEKFVAQFGADRIVHFRFDHVEAILARAALPRVEGGKRLGGPSAARNLRRELLPFFDYAIKLLGLQQPNPVAQASPVAVPASDGFHAWTEAEIAQYRARHPLGTQARLAMEVLLWTGLRRGDAARFGRRHLVEGEIAITPAKTRGTSGKALRLPAAPQLLAAIEATTITGTETFLVTEYGRPFTTAGLGNKMRQWCDEAGLPHCTAHGLRKALARRAAELGASNAMLKAVGAWETDAMVGGYTRSADQRALASEALTRVIAFDLANRDK